MFNLENVKEEWISKKTLFKYINEYDIYHYYIGQFTLGKSMSSPFRRDNNPSFNIFINFNGDLSFMDYKLGSGNAITFVGFMENVSYFQAMSILNERYNVGLLDLNNNKVSSIHTKKPVITNVKVIEKAEVFIDIKVRQWELWDKEYWSQYEVSSSTLEWFNIYPIQRFWINDSRFNVDKYAYAYYFDDRVYKIYQPYLDKGKWWSNIKNKEIYQGHNQLPETGDILFVTSSLKDVAVLYEAGYSAVAPYTEHQILSDTLYQHYSERFNMIVILYDNDSAGQLHANKMVDKYGLKSLVLPDDDTKDPSDFVKKYDLNSLKEWINDKI